MKKLIYLISVVVAFVGFSAQAVTLHEWTFDTDPSGRTLANATNTVSTNRFSAGGAGFLETDGLGTLRCTFNDSGTTGLWTNGALLSAGVGNLTNGTYFIRYDLEYDINDTSNDSGTLAGLAFTDATGAKVAGVALQYDVGAVTAPTNLTVTDFTSLTNLIGKVSLVARVNMTTKKMDVWYDLTGTGSFSAEVSPQATNIAVNMTAINNLRLQMTGDFTNSVKVGQIQMSDSFASAIAAPPELSISVSNSLSGVMDIGNTNIVSVVIRNNGGRPTTSTTSILTNNITSSAFAISSNNAVQTLAGGLSITNTYALTANTNGTYHFTIRATSAETNSAQTNLLIVVGSQISYLTNSIADGAGGTVAGKYESGETISITVISTNNGARTVTNIINTLSANPVYFSISPASNTYPSMTVGGSRSSIYTVVISNTTPAGNYTFSVTNQAGSLVWTDSFTLPVLLQANPAVSTTSLTIDVASGETNNTTLLLSNFGSATNSGNKSVKFTLSDDGRLPLGSYIASTQDLQIVGLPARDVPYFTWTENSSASTNIGFAFPFNGALYTNFSVSAYGAITFGGETAGANPGETTLIGGSTVVAPFWSGSAVSTNTIRYRSEATRLVISWGSGTGNEFQAWLHKNGQIDYIYEAGTWSSAAIGVQTGDAAQNIGYTPGEAFQSLHLTPQSWVTYAPTNGTVAGRGSNTVTFTANAAGKGAQTNVFNTYVTWDNGTTSTVAVTVRVLNSIYGLTIAPTNVVTFFGAAGITKTTNAVSLINTGNVALAYTVTDLSAQTNGYAWTNTTYSRETFSISGSKSLYGMDENNSGWLTLGFPFSFYGNVYTQLFVNINGSIELVPSTQTNLNSSRIIAPYMGNLYLDPNAKVFYSSDANQMVITWQNIAQTGGGNDLTFQTVLNRNGNILFQYQQLNDTNAWPGTFIGVQDTASSNQTSASLANSQTTTTTTNYSTSTTNYTTVTTNQNGALTTNVYDEIIVTNGTNLVVTYNPVTEQAILITPSTRIGIITVSPLSGTIPARGTNVLTLIGDARSLLFTTNLPNYSVTNRTTFNISYINSNKTLSATFIATNSSTAAYASDKAKADMWGADPVFTSQQNADGSYTLSWSPADDGISRTYRVLYTTNLMCSDNEWIKLEPLIVNGTSYVVDINDIPAESAIFYKVTVE